jgi:hypothetical protein
MVKLFRANIMLKRSLFQEDQCFYALSGIQEYHRFYYNKSQQHILDNLLTLIAERFNKREAIFDQSECHTAKQFNAVRLVDP